MVYTSAKDLQGKLEKNAEFTCTIFKERTVVSDVTNFKDFISRMQSVVAESIYTYITILAGRVVS